MKEQCKQDFAYVVRPSNFVKGTCTLPAGHTGPHREAIVLTDEENRRSKEECERFKKAIDESFSIKPKANGKANGHKKA